MATTQLTFADLAIRRFSAEELSSVAYQWQAVAGDDEFKVELSAVFEWCADHLVPLPGDGHAMQVFSPQTGETLAILEMVDTRRGTLTKLLKVWVAPRFWPADRDPTVSSEFIDLYAGILARVIANTMTSDLGEVRIYGRTEALDQLLRHVASKWGSLNSSWVATMQGRWFSLTRGSTP